MGTKYSQEMAEMHGALVGFQQNSPALGFGGDGRSGQERVVRGISPVADPEVKKGQNWAKPRASVP